MSDNDDYSFTSFVKCLGIFFILCILAVPFGMLVGQLLKYFMGL